MEAQSLTRNPQIRAPHPFTRFADEDVEQSIARRFEEQVRAHGDRLAIQSDQRALTYADLNRLANRLAHKILSAQGTRSEPIVLLFDHGPDAVAAILGVLKAGKFFVVLDPDYPRERLRDLVSDSGSRLIVADRSHVAQARDISQEATSILDFADDREGPPDANPDPLASADDLAMIIYTSGSTGRPKGVMHTQRNVLADTANVTNDLAISKHDRFVWHTSIGFAGSARTIFSALLNGSSIYPFDSKRQGFAQFPQWLLGHEITIFRTVPTTFRSFMATLPDALVFPSVRILSMGGEPVFRADLDSFNRHFSPGCVLVHPFGPTESMAVCWSVTPHGGQIAGNKLPIGYPLRGKHVLVLDESGQPVEDEQIGEIAVQSRYLSPGYWRDAARTQAAFLGVAGSDDCIYLTGDLGVRSKDGCLSHVGRRDFQVKIRGFRIDVTEIETALRAIDGISDAVVVGRAIDSGDTRLIAYFVPSSKPARTVTELRDKLTRMLPDYMLPAAFVVMDALPRTANGKTDRLNLPAVERNRPEIAVPFAPPRTPIEEALAQLWADALGLDQVGIHDDFFEAGGDSLMVMRLIARVKAGLGVDFPITDFFDGPTIAQAAIAISSLKGSR